MFPDRSVTVAKDRMTPLVRGSVLLHVAAAGLCVALPPMWGWALGAVVLDHAALAAAGMAPRSRLLGPNLRRLPATGRPELALTFDDGPDPAVTPAVLDMLDEFGAKATFFCIGAAARAHPGVVRAIAGRGHAVENHTDRHLAGFAFLPPAALRREIGAAQDTLTDLAGSPPQFLRAPMGLRSPLLEPVLASAGLRLASWTRRALDGMSGNSDAARTRLLSGLGPGDVLLMHDGRAARTAQGRAVVLEVLPAVLEASRRLGLRCVTLGDGIRSAGLAPCPAGQEFRDQTDMHPSQQHVVAAIAKM